MRAAAGAGRSGAGAVPGVGGSESGSAGKMDEFQAAEEVTGQGIGHGFPPGVSFQGQRRVSGGAHPLLIPPLGVPRRHPCRPPAGWSRVSRAPAAGRPSLCSASPGASLSPRCSLCSSTLAFTPAAAGPSGKRREGRRGLGLSPPEEPSAVVGGWPVLFGPGEKSSELFLCGKRSPSLWSACYRRTHGASHPIPKIGNGINQGSQSIIVPHDHLMSPHEGGGSSQCCFCRGTVSLSYDTHKQAGCDWVTQ